MAKLRKVRWAHLSELDRSKNVGSPEWRKVHTPKQRRLTAWRYLHTLRAHSTVSKYGREKGKAPSSNMTTPQMISLAKQFSKRKRPNR